MLEDDHLCRYDVALGPANVHPDFVVLQPWRGLLVLQVRDWRRDSVIEAAREHVLIHGVAGPGSVANPLELARRHAEAAIDVLRRDPQLVLTSRREAGRPLFPWSYGVVLANLTPKAPARIWPTATATTRSRNANPFCPPARSTAC